MSYDEYHSKHVLSLDSEIFEVRSWEVSKEVHYVETSDGNLIPLPPVFSLVGRELYDGKIFTKEPYYNHSIETIQSFVKQVEEYYYTDKPMDPTEIVFEDVEHYNGRIM